MIETREIEMREIPEGLRGLRVLHVSDLHMTRWSGRRDAKVAAELRGVDCDLVLLSGDYVNRASQWRRLGKWLATALPDVPRFAVPGNWDHRMSEDLADLRQAMGEAGVELLVNESHRLKLRGEPVAVVGMDDVRFGWLDVEAAFGEVKTGDLVLAVAHSPDILLHLDAGRFHLLVCGHTHGGQVCIPGYGAILTSTQLGKRFESGLYELGGGAKIYVSRGVGTGRVPFRIWCPPELALLQLGRILDGSTNRK